MDIEEGRWISLWDYFRLHGIKVSEPKKEIPKVEFLQLSEDTKIRIVDYRRCSTFDNWPLDESGNLIWNIGITEEQNGK